MQKLVANIKWVMLVAGALTCSMLFAAIAPQAALRSMFGATLDGPLAEIVVRSWGALIALVGGMLIYGAFHPRERPLILTVAALSKATFIALVLTYGQAYLGKATPTLLIDAVMVTLFAAYLLATRAKA